MTTRILFSKLTQLICAIFLLSVLAVNGFAQTDYLESFLQQNGGKSTFLTQPNPLNLEKARRVSQILHELKTMRENFLQTGNLIDIFPTVYYHVTIREFENALSGKFQNPTAILDLIINFYEIYKANRQSFLKDGIGAVDPQWREFYQKAVSGNDYRRKSSNLFKPLIMLWKVKQILQSGFAGHINFDLPCAISKTLQNSDSDRDIIYRDFRAGDAIMQKADDDANRDISKTLFKKSRAFAKISLNLGARFIFLGHKINRMRVEAWKAGSGSEGLKMCQIN